MRNRLGRRRLWLGLVAVAAVAGAASVAYASIPDSGTIHGCYANNNGALRVIDATAGGACKSTETALDWQQQGLPDRPARPVRRERPARPVRRVRQAPPEPPERPGQPEQGPDRGDGRDRAGRLARHGPGDRAAHLGAATRGLPAVHADAVCPSGEMAVSGGYFVVNLDPNAPPTVLVSWRPQLDTWQVDYYNPAR